MAWWMDLAGILRVSWSDWLKHSGHNNLNKDYFARDAMKLSEGLMRFEWRRFVVFSQVKEYISHKKEIVCKPIRSFILMMLEL